MAESKNDPKTAGYRKAIYDFYEKSQGVAVPEALKDLEYKASRLRKLIRESFPPDRNAKILELGCGHGALIHFARLEGYNNISGVDVSPGQVEAARKMGIPGISRKDALEELKGAKDGSLDAVITYDFLEHFTKEEAWTIALEVARVLVAGGRWIIRVPNSESPFGMTLVHGDFTHETAYNRHSIDQLVRSAGFSSCEFSEDPPLVHGLVSGLRALVWWKVKLILRVILAAETGDLGRSRIFSQNLNAVARK